MLVKALQCSSIIGPYLIIFDHDCHHLSIYGTAYLPTYGTIFVNNSESAWFRCGSEVVFESGPWGQGGRGGQGSKLG